jgi:hypothetical protein
MGFDSEALGEGVDGLCVGGFGGGVAEELSGDILHSKESHEKEEETVVAFEDGTRNHCVQWEGRFIL